MAPELIDHGPRDVRREPPHDRAGADPRDPARMLAPMEAAFFDLDKTVIAKPSMVAFGRPLYDAGMISRWLIVRAMWSNMLFHYLGADEERMRKFRESALRITAGWDQALISAIVRDTLADVIEPIVYEEALDLIRHHQAAGRRVFIISASPEEIVAPLAQYLGVDEAIASRARLDDEGRYTGEVEFWSYGPYKAEAICEIAERQGIDLGASYAYSDSGTDVPMLELVGHPVAVNPDRDLARVAKEREWDIRTFQIGVPLRDRVAMPARGRALGVLAVATVVVVTGAGAAWWLLHRRALAAPPSSPLRQYLEDQRVRVGARTNAGRSRRWERQRAGGTPRSDGSWLRVRRPGASSPQRQRGRAGRRSR